jgi:undecaprenyl-diphosphatase
MASFVQNVLTSVPAWVAYLIVFLLPFLEASILLGFVIPGETALVFGGVLASQGHISLVAVLLLAILGAVAGDGIGYAVGRRYGRALQQSRLGRVVGAARWTLTEDFLQRRGGPAVFFGRFTALLRALVPGAAGMARLPYRTFAIWNLCGGALWASACVIGGFAVGDVIGNYLSNAGYVIVGVVVVAVVLLVVRSRRATASTGEQPAGEQPTNIER